jgi:glycosyltransferase involved in cell wall biosynthesis
MEMPGARIPEYNRASVKKRKLVVISHTEHYSQDGLIVGWGPTINELNHLADHWDEVLHVACLHNGDAPASSRPYTNVNTRFVPIQPFGGASVWRKLNILWSIPDVLSKVGAAIDGATHVQLRVPTGIGVYLLPVFSFIFRRNFLLWAKYAGNWGQANAPLGYRFQRWWLKKNLTRCSVTINGHWNDQPEHCLSFENPCLTDEDISIGRDVQFRKTFAAPFRFVFVGRLEDQKGVRRIIQALKTVNLELIDRVDFVGGGPRLGEYEAMCSFLGERVFFHGFMGPQEVHRVLSSAHFFILPSDSEGFPKAVAEAACYGCVPIVSDAGSIGHYVTSDIGFVWKLDGSQSLSDVVDAALASSSTELFKKSANAVLLAEDFTQDKYIEKLKTMVFGEAAHCI